MIVPTSVPMSNRFEFLFSNNNGNDDYPRSCPCSEKRTRSSHSHYDQRIFWSRNDRVTHAKKTKQKSVGKKTDEYRKDSLAKFIRRLTIRSSFVGLSRIAASKSTLGKSIWTVITVTCITGFIYQALKFVFVYQDLPTEVTLRVENNGTVEFPAVTICNNNRIRKSEYCEHYPEECSPETPVKLSEARVLDLYFEALNSESRYKFQLGHTMSFIKGCIFNGMIPINSSECMRRFVPFFDPDYGNCFTFQAVEHEGLEDLTASEADFWDNVNDLILLLDQEREEYTEEKRQPGMTVTVHANEHTPDLHTDSIQVEGGSVYSFAVEQSVTMLLPSPYKTNCTDFVELPWVSERAIPSSRICTVGCSVHFQFESCGYVTRNLSLFYEELPWDITSVTEAREECAANIEENTKSYCRSLCGVPCKDIQFEVAVGKTVLQKSEVTDFITEELNIETKDDLIAVRVFYKTIERKVYEHGPMYDDLELFSYLGGYSGVWLGFSLLNLCEMIEIILSSANYAFLKFKRKPNVSRKKFRSSDENFALREPFNGNYSYKPEKTKMTKKIKKCYNC